MSIRRLWITEKPDMAKNLAAGLALTYDTQVINSKDMRSDGCLRLGNGDAVAPLRGHMLQLAPPEEYLTAEQNRGDVFAYLPLLPERFIKLPKPDMKDGKALLDKAGKPVPPYQFGKLLELLKAAREVVNAGDVDREGQLIVNELLLHAGIDPGGADKPVWRLALTNPDANEIRKLVTAGLEKNGDPKWALRYEAAYTRETFDWCVGMTASRAYRQVSGYAKMSVGRVTTPTLMMVVNREIQIETFKSVQYFVPVITLADGTTMRWFRRAGAEGQPGFDQEGRIVHEAVARQICSAIMGGARGEISLAQALKKFQPPPLPHSLGTLQSTVARRTGMSLKEVTKAAQSLYERRKMITYVGTDCRFLPESMLQDAHQILKGLSRVFAREANGASLDIRGRAFDTAKTDEHYAIAPTGVVEPGLSQEEMAVYKAVSQRFMAQFYPDHEYVAMKLQAQFGQDEFKATDREVTVAGWKQVEYDPDDKEAGEGDELGVDGEKKAERSAGREQR